MSGQCPIWGTPAELTTGGDGTKAHGQRTDGTYRISGTAQSMLASLGPAERARLTTWIVDQHRYGEASPMVTSHTIEQVQNSRGLRMSERKDRFFRCLISRFNVTPSFRFVLEGPQGPETERNKNLFLAWLECADDRDLMPLINLLVEEGYISKEPHPRITLTSKGFERLEMLEAGNPDSAQGFVAMWFDHSMSEAASAIEAAIVDTGYSAMRIDNKEHSGDITDAIISEIRRSRFVVADFTCAVIQHDENPVGVPRGGVYFEAGFALGLGLQVIWTCRSDCMPHLHFDTRQHAHVVWESPSDLREKLTRRIGAVIGFRPGARVKAPDPHAS